MIVLGFTLAMVAADMATEHEGARKDWLGSSIALGIASGMALICPLGLAVVIGLPTREQVWYWTVGAAVASSGLAARRNRTVRVRLEGTMLVVPHAWGTYRYPVGQISTAMLAGADTIKVVFADGRVRHVGPIVGAAFILERLMGRIQGAA